MSGARRPRPNPRAALAGPYALVAHRSPPRNRHPFIGGWIFDAQKPMDFIGVAAKRRLRVATERFSASMQQMNCSIRAAARAPPAALSAPRSYEISAIDSSRLGLIGVARSIRFLNRKPNPPYGKI